MASPSPVPRPPTLSQAGAARDRRSRRLFVVGLGAMVLLYFAYGLKRFALGIDFTDEGAYVSWPLRMLFGEKPFAAELGTLLRPLVAYLGLVFKLWPHLTLYEFRLLGWSIHLLSFCVLATYLFRLSGAPLRSLLIASLPFFACHLFGLASPSYNSLSSDFLLIALSLRALGSAAGAGWPKTLHAGSGLALFLATLAHPVLGLVAAVIVLHELIRHDLAKNALRRRPSPSNVGVWVFVTCWAVFVADLAASGALAVWYQRVALFRSFTVSSIETYPIHSWFLVACYPFAFSRPAMFGSSLVVFAAAVVRFYPHGRPILRAGFAAVLALLAVAFLIYGFSYRSNLLPVFFAQAALFLIAGHVLGWIAPDQPADPAVRFLLAMSGLGALLYMTVTFYFSPLRSWQSGILALPFGFAVGLTLLLEARPGRLTALFHTLATAMLVLAVACVAREHFRTIYRDAAPAELSATFRAPKLHPIRSTEERVGAVDALYEYLHPKIARGEPLLVFDDCPMLYYLLDAMPAYGLTWATRYTQSPAALAQLDREFRAKPLPRYAIRTLVDVSAPVWAKGRRIDYRDYPLNETVIARYELERTIFPFEIWRLKTIPP